MRAGTSKRNRLFRGPCTDAGLKARSVTVAGSRLSREVEADAKQIKLRDHPIEPKAGSPGVPRAESETIRDRDAS